MKRNIHSLNSELDENNKKKATQDTSIYEGILVLKGVADSMQKIREDAYARAQEKRAHRVQILP